MSEIKNPVAYFKRAIMNSLKNEYRQNDNAYKHISPVGDLIDSLRDRAIQQEEWESEIGTQDLDSWLMFLNNEALYRAIKLFSREDQYILFLLFCQRLSQKEIALQLGVSQATISNRWTYMKRSFKKFFSK